MARTRNWPPEKIIEILVRHSTFKQNPAEIARGVDLSYQQVRNFLMTGTKLAPEPDSEWQRTLQAQITERVEAEIRALVQTFVSKDGKVRTCKRAPLTAAQQLELEEEVVGCCDLVIAAAAQFGITPRRFLHLCITNARSAV